MNIFYLFRDSLWQKVPVIVGEHDHNTPVELVQKCYYYPEAPEKDLVVIEECAHAPFIGDPEKFKHEVPNVKKNILPDLEKLAATCNGKRLKEFK